MWEDWCNQCGWSPWLPLEQSTHSTQLALFATYYWTAPPHGRGNAPDTILSKISAISWHHRLRCGYPVGLHQGHLLAMQGMRRMSSPPAAKAPATNPMLRSLRASCDFNSAHDRVLWEAALVGWFYLLRSAEYLQVNGTVSSTAVRRTDVTLRDHRGRHTQDPQATVRVDISLRGSKTDQEGRATVLSLERSGSGWLCPVLAVLDLLNHARSQGIPTSAPLCAVDASRTIKASTLIARLRAAAAECNIDGSRVGTHSLRSGGATALMAAGADKQVIKQFGRWISDSVDRYTRITAQATRTLSSRMASARVNTRLTEDP